MENPKIRFKGFTKDWEQRKFSDIASRESVSRESSYALPSVEYEDVIAEEGRLNKDISLKENIKKGIVFDGSQVLYGKLRPYLHNWLNPDFSGVAVGDWWVLKPNNADKSFIYRIIQTQRFDDIANQSAGSKMPRADWNLVSNTEFAVPVSLEEQEKIGEYFSSLDHLITLHQRKCEQTKKLKKYMLQKMFPQNGAKVPEIRFNGFTHDWEQRKLSDVLDIVTKRNGEKYGKEEVLSVSDEYGCINQIKFQGRSFAGEDISNYKIVDTGDIIYTRSPLKSKPYGIIKVVGDEIGIVSPLYIVNKVKEGNNSQFIYRVFDSPEKTNKYLSPLVRKGAKNTMNISNDEWLSGKIDVAPSYEEQYQIGLYFDHLDNLITLHQRQCDELKKMKKYMLQNMFI